MGMRESMLPVFIGLYIVLAMAFAFIISKGFLKKISRSAREMDLEFAILASPSKAYSQVKHDVERQSSRRFFLGIIFFIGFIGIVFILTLVRNYYNTSHPFVTKISSPSDWISIILPEVTAIIMLLASIYKEVLIKFISYSFKARIHHNAADSFFENSHKLGLEAIEYEQEAKNMYEAIPISKELAEVIARYSNESILTTRQETLLLNVQRGGQPVANCQVQGVTSNDDRIYSVTDKQGHTSLTWTVGQYLKKILIGRLPLEGVRFQSGQIITVDLDSLDNRPNGLLN
jgi:hypothetical protein